MKRVLITGANSYIGTSFEKYLNDNYAGEYAIDTVDMLDSNWEKKDFSIYDSVFHVAGIAHSDNGKISKEKEALYYAVNTDLTINVAKKAKFDGVKQFVFMSSAIVYGDSASIGKEKIIMKDTPISPANCYGDSKVQAERGLLEMEDHTFKVVLLRPPMIYGKGSKGNYPMLSKVAKKLPIFPHIHNQRSMLYIENLCEFIHMMLKNEESGIFWPQNNEYSNTSELVEMIAYINGKNIVLIKGCQWILKLMSHCTSLVNKAFGSLTYDLAISEYKEDYRVVSNIKETIRRTEGKY